MPAIVSTPGAAPPLRRSIVARLPLAMLSIGLLVHAEHLTGSFAAAGRVTGAYAVAARRRRTAARPARRPPRPDAVLLASARGRGRCCCASWPRCARRRAGAGLVALAAGIGARHAAGRRLPARAAPHGARPTPARRAPPTPSRRPRSSSHGSPARRSRSALGALCVDRRRAGARRARAPAPARSAFALQPASRDWRPGRRRPRGRAAARCGRPRCARSWSSWSASACCSAPSRSPSPPPPTRSAARPPPPRPLLALWGAGSLLGGLLAARLGGGAQRRRARARARRARGRAPGAGAGRRQRRSRSAPCCSSPAPRSPRPTRPSTRWSTAPPRRAP